jgi:hypothetical protein
LYTSLNQKEYDPDLYKIKQHINERDELARIIANQKLEAVAIHQLSGHNNTMLHFSAAYIVCL